MRRLSLPLVLSLCLALACVTINVYFPEGEIKDLSQQIEREVARQAKERAGQEPAQPEAAKPDPPQQPPQSRRPRGLLDELFGVAYAQGSVPEAEATSPAIRRIIESRSARLAELNRYKAQGVIGENRKGLVEVRALESLPDLKARADVQRLVRAENADREELYKEIAAAKNVDLSQLDRIRETYAQTLRANARPGDWIQLDDGSWKQK